MCNCIFIIYILLINAYIRCLLIWYEGDYSMKVLWVHLATSSIPVIPCEVNKQQDQRAAEFPICSPPFLFCWNRSIKPLDIAPQTWGCLRNCCKRPGIRLSLMWRWIWWSWGNGQAGFNCSASSRPWWNLFRFVWGTCWPKFSVFHPWQNHLFDLFVVIATGGISTLSRPLWTSNSWMTGTCGGRKRSTSTYHPSTGVSAMRHSSRAIQQLLRCKLHLGPTGFSILFREQR